MPVPSKARLEIDKPEIPRVGDQVFVHVSTELETRLRKDIPVAERPHHLNPIVR